MTKRPTTAGLWQTGRRLVILDDATSVSSVKRRTSLPWGITDAPVPDVSTEPKLVLQRHRSKLKLHLQMRVHGNDVLCDARHGRR
jgi:hypothetical protein